MLIRCVDFNKKNFFSNNFITGFTLFSLTFLYLTLWIFQGLDFTDEGYNLTKGWLIFNGGITNQLDLTFGSSFICGLWNQIIPGNYLLFSRIGYVLAVSISALFAYLILVEFFERKLVFLSVLATVPITYSTLVRVLNYNNVPALFFLFFLYCFILAYKFKDKNNLRYYSFLILSGIFFSFCIISRLMLIVFLLYPLAIIIYNFIFKDKKISWFKSYIIYLAGFLIGIVVFLILLYKFNYLNAYINNTFGFLLEKSKSNDFQDSHTFKNSIIIILKYYYYTVLFLPLSLLSFYFFSLLFKIKNKLVSYILISLILLSLIYFTFKYLKIYGVSNNIYFVFFGLSLFFLIYYIIKSKNIKSNFLIILILFYQITFFIGSDAINWQNLYLSLPLLLIVFEKIKELNFDNFFSNVFNFKKISTLIAIYIILFGVAFNFFTIFRDSHNRTQLFYPFSIKNFKGIYTTQIRRNTVEQMLNKLQGLIKKKDKIIFANSIPIFYYITQTIPANSDPWAINMLDTEKYKEEINKILSEKQVKVIVIAKGSTQRDIYWPQNVNTILIHQRMKDKLNYLYLALKINNYKLIWQNNGFDIYTVKN